MDMCYDGALVMPSSFAMISEEEMTYVEGGLKAPNWLVAGAINLAIASAFGSVGTFLTKVSKKNLSKAAKIIFAKKLKKKLIAKGVVSGLAGAICGYIPAVLTICGAVLDPGGYLAGRFDARDCKPNNGYCNI